MLFKIERGCTVIDNLYDEEFDLTNPQEDLD